MGFKVTPEDIEKFKVVALSLGAVGDMVPENAAAVALLIGLSLSGSERDTFVRLLLKRTF